jgi:hypothetical protein
MLTVFIVVDQREQLGPSAVEIQMRTSPKKNLPEFGRHAQGPGGEGGSVLRQLLGAPTHLTEALTPHGLLAISLLLSVLLVGLAALALGT